MESILALIFKFSFKDRNRTLEHHHNRVVSFIIFYLVWLSELLNDNQSRREQIAVERSQQALQHSQGLGAFSIGAQSLCK